jgi:hypothetical protein
MEPYYRVQKISAPDQEQDEFNPLHHILFKIHFNICLAPNWLLPFILYDYISVGISNLSMRATCTVCLTLLDLIIVIIFSAE